MHRNQAQVDAAARSLLRALVSIGTVVLVGTIGYMLIEGWDFWSALFFTVITITTVGYGDNGLTEAGERFTAVLLLGGLGVATYSFSLLVQSAVQYRIARECRMIRKVQHLSNHVIVCGLGRMGRMICRQLHESEHPFVALDTSESAVDQAADEGWIALAGDATEDEFLEAAGIERAHCVVCVTAGDTENIVIALSARHLSQDVQIISRIEHETNVCKIERAGADVVVSPATSGASQVVQCLLRPSIADALAHGANDTGLALAELKIEAGSTLDGTTVADYASRNGDVVFVALSRPGCEDHRRPGPDDTLAHGDRLVVAGNADQLSRIGAHARAARAAA
jgi:voltage-gated potassium channel